MRDLAVAAYRAVPDLVQATFEHLPGTVEITGGQLHNRLGENVVADGQQVWEPWQDTASALQVERA